MTPAETEAKHGATEKRAEAAETSEEFDKVVAGTGEKGQSSGTAEDSDKVVEVKKEPVDEPCM